MNRNRGDGMNYFLGILVIVFFLWLVYFFVSNNKRVSLGVGGNMNLGTDFGGNLNALGNLNTSTMFSSQLNTLGRIGGSGALRGNSNFGGNIGGMFGTGQ